MAAMKPTLAGSILACAIAWSLSACSGAAVSDDPPVIGKKRGVVCTQAFSPDAFRCPAEMRQRGKAEAGRELWCEDERGARQGPYRRFPPSASDIAEPGMVADGVVVGGYENDLQNGAWFTYQGRADVINVAFYVSGKVSQRLACRPPLPEQKTNRRPDDEIL